MGSKTVGVLRRSVTGPNLPALIVSLIVAVMGSLFVVTYSLAMGDPRPNNVPIGVVGNADLATQVGNALNAQNEGEFLVQTFVSEQTAQVALDQQLIYAIYEPGSAGTASLVLSSASGASVARVLEQVYPQVGSTLGVTITVTDAHPLAANDPSGLVLFYLALGASILGFVGAIQTRVNAAGLTLVGEIAWDLIRSAVASLTITLVVGPILGLERFPVLPVWALLTTMMLIGGMVYSFWRVAIGGRWALLPTWILFILVANPSSGGAVAPELLPPFYEFVGRWMPTGSAIQVLRDVTYFPDGVHAEPILVLAGWLVISTAAFVLVRWKKFGTGRLDPSPSTPSAAKEEAVPA